MTDFLRISDLVMRLGQPNTSLEQEFIVQLPSKYCDSWRKRVSKAFEGGICARLQVTFVSNYKRNGYLLSATLPHGQEITLLVADTKSRVMIRHDVVDIFSKTSQISAFVLFKPYLHFELGFVLLVDEISLDQTLTGISLDLVEKRVSRTLNSPKNHRKSWDSKQDDFLLDALKRDVGIREIACNLQRTPFSIVDRMTHLRVCDQTTSNEIKDALRNV